ncbi:MAG: patatin-like phospholipase family protein [Gemmatimonadota bacterium]
MAEERRVALALGSGGARGYAHIGVIEELEAEGFEIVGIAGTSMGALVGGLYCADRLPAYTDWVRALTHRDMLRLLDPAFIGPGMVRAEKILAKITELVGDTAIEDLRLPFTAVATDLSARKEVWFQRGRLDAAIRASIAIPGLITPVVMRGRLLADGGLMNPLPVVATAAIPADLTVAVSLSEEYHTTAASPTAPWPGQAGTITEPDEQAEREPGAEPELMRTLTSWLQSIRGQVAEEVSAGALEHGPEPLFEALPAGLRTRDVLDLSLDTLRSVLAKYRLAGYPPDVLITIPQDACGTMDFHRAAELIALGRARARAALAEMAR